MKIFVRQASFNNYISDMLITYVAFYTLLPLWHMCNVFKCVVKITRSSSLVRLLFFSYVELGSVRKKIIILRGSGLVFSDINFIKYYWSGLVFHISIRCHMSSNSLVHFQHIAAVPLGTSRKYHRKPLIDHYLFIRCNTVSSK